MISLVVHISEKTAMLEGRYIGSWICIEIYHMYCIQTSFVVRAIDQIELAQATTFDRRLLGLDFFVASDN